ncbi:MAG: signal peptidase I [Chlamydiota bacterium]
MLNPTISMSEPYKLRKSKRIFLLIYKLYQRKKKSLSPKEHEELKNCLEKSQENILAKNTEAASQTIKNLENLSASYLKKTFFEQTRDFIGAIVFALVVAIFVRQMWFEFYEIPTGSMRPTLKEQDRLVVSKTQFGINIPLTTKQVYFDPNLVQRGGIVVFTGQDMDIHDVDTMYFYLFPGKKQYIKRLIGKPGDTLYFYGGKIYGVDKDGHDVSHELQRPSLSQVDHIPFISFEGKVSTSEKNAHGVYNSVVLHQMNEPIAKMKILSGHRVSSELLPLKTSEGKQTPPSYEDLWGFKNYAMARIVHKKEYLTLNGANLENLKPTDYYLELVHNPNLKGAKLQRDLYGRLRPILGLNYSYIPLDETHLKDLFNNLYTARFVVEKSGHVRRYGYKKSEQSKSFQPKLDHIPAGTYEFYYGKAYQIFWQGITKELPPSHPIYQFTKENLYTLFNLGIEFDTRFLPEANYPLLLPSRYAFFRDQTLYVMGTALFKQTDPLLQAFLQQEKIKQHHSTAYSPYLPFVDHGAPLLENGLLDTKTVLRYGIKVPDNGYLVLGDNYAMSADSRDFGFVPQNNLRGVPNFIFWPPGNHFGFPNQASYPVFVLPRLLIWLIAGLIITAAIILHRKRYRLPIDKRLSDKSYYMNFLNFLFPY